jgi:hypothetical protein
MSSVKGRRAIHLAIDDERNARERRQRRASSPDSSGVMRTTLFVLLCMITMGGLTLLQVLRLQRMSHCNVRIIKA